MEKYMTCCEEVEFTRMLGVNDETTHALNVGGIGTADGLAKGGSKWLNGLGSELGGMNWLVELHMEVGLRLMDLNMDIIDTNDQERLTTCIPDTHWAQACPLHLWTPQIGLNSGGDNGFPDLVKVIGSNRLELLHNKVGFSSHQLDPEIDTGPSNEGWLGGEAIVIKCTLNGGRDAGSVGIHPVDSVVNEADMDGRLGVIGTRLSNMGLDVGGGGGGRHWKGKKIRQ